MKFAYTLYFLFASLFFFATASLAAPPSGAVKFVILQPSNSTVGTPVTVTVEARNQNNQVDIAYQNDVTLVTSGSASGGGLINIVNGVGTREINDAVAETIILSLSDTELTDLSVDSTREVVFAPLGGGAVWNQQKFWFRDDDGDEITATGFWTENIGQNANIINVVRGTNFRLRFAVKLTDADGSIAPTLEFKKGTDCATGSWTVADSASSVFSLQLSQNFTDGATTTQQVSTGKNFIAGQILESTNPAVSLNMLKNQSTEYEWSLKASQDIPFAATYSFRITNNGTVLDTYDQCASLTVQAAPPPPPAPSGGGGGGGGGVRPTMVTFSGKAFPGAKIFVIDRDVRFDKILSEDVVTSDDGSFHTSFVGILQSQHSFGLIVKDKELRTAQTKSFNIDTLADDLVAKDIVVSPTIGFINRSVARGQTAVIIGYASPESSVSLEINGIIKKEIKAEKDGSYKGEVSTGDLDFGSYRVRVKQAMAGEKRESDFSPTNTLVISRLVLPKADLSGDGKVDIKDWSMFLSRWSSKDMEQKKLIDFNEDGKIDISDFSIFVRNIRKKF